MCKYALLINSFVKLHLFFVDLQPEVCYGHAIDLLPDDIFKKIQINELKKYSHAEVE